MSFVLVGNHFETFVFTTKQQQLLYRKPTFSNRMVLLVQKHS